MLISPIGRGILAALMFLVAILWMSWARMHPPEEILHVTGEVIEVHTTGIGSAGTPAVKVRLDDGRVVAVLIGGFVPQPGQVLPFVMESHGEGKDAYITFDHEAWLDGNYAIP